MNFLYHIFDKNNAKIFNKITFLLVSMVILKVGNLLYTVPH